MELALTVDELITTYGAIKDQQIEEFKLIAKANGATFKDEEGEEDPDAFNRIVQEVKERNGETVEQAPSKKLGLFNINSI